ILMLTPRQLVASGVRDDYFAYHLMSAEDWPRVMRTLELSNTQASSLAFANASAFFGLRAGVRNWITEQVFPDLGKLTSLMTRQTALPLRDESVYPVAVERLAALREETGVPATKIVLMIPPTAGKEAGHLASTVQRGG